MKKVGLLLVVLVCTLCVSGNNLNRDLLVRLKSLNVEQYQMSLDNLKKSFPDNFSIDPETNHVLDRIKKSQSDLIQKIEKGDLEAINEVQAILNRLDNQMLQNPLLAGKRLLTIKRYLGDKSRQAMGGSLGLSPSNFQNNSEIWNPKKGWKNEMQLLTFQNGKLNTEKLYAPIDSTIVMDPEVHYSGKKILFSSIGTSNRWHIFELDVVTKKIKQITPESYKDFDSFDACYTPDDRIIFCSTATYLGLPCTDGGNKMCGLFLYDPKTGKTRQLTFDQDSNWGPVVMNDGQILYQRWEYADLPHSNSRLLFTMNPDGTTQSAFYGSNSYFPTAFFNARPIPGNKTAVVGIAGGHHSVSRSGRMLIIDPTVGRKEADGVVAEIPYYGKKVFPIVRDRLPDGVWPQFLQPYPLNDKYFIVSMKADPNSLWGLYLVDIYGNITLMQQEEGAAFIDPVLLESYQNQPIIPDRVNLNSKTATVFLQNVYEGDGLKGIPKGEVKKLRIFSYGFSPLGQGGLLGTIGMDGPWDVKRIIGTVDVEPDGSAMFVIPANTPIGIQPLDSEGKALQIMRSWFTGMPGENLSCIGCHEDKNSIPPPRASAAARKKPQQIKEWYGKARGFSFEHEVQPVLDRACVACHNEKNTKIPNFKGDKKITDWKSQISGAANPSYGGNFTISYANLHKYVRRPGIESDMDMLVPMDVHADQTELMQILQKGHHGVKLTPEEVERIACWIDMNAPFHGHRTEINTYSRTENGRKLRKLYAEMFGLEEPDLEVLPEKPMPVKAEYPQKRTYDKGVDSIPGWPIKNNDIINRQIWQGQYQISIPLSEDIALDMVKIPGGKFIMGSTKHPDEMPRTEQDVKAFWIGRFEITNRIYSLFDPKHDSRDEHRHGYQFGRKGYSMNHPDQPVVRISWHEAMNFCKWLSDKTGKKVSLPTEAQWEWACRAGQSTPYSFGDFGSDFTNYANLGDIKLKEFAACTAFKNYESTRVIDNPGIYDDWIPRDTLYNDGGFISEIVGRYRANMFDLYDMHGNVWEWTRSSYLPYPYRDDDGRNGGGNEKNERNERNEKNEGNEGNENNKKVVRGGSWYDRPYRATSSFRLPYRSYQKVYNVGFRVVVEE